MSLILGVYLVIQILVLSSLMVMQIDLIPHAITMTLSCIAYFVVAFKNPGYFQGQQKTAPSLEDQINDNNKVPSDQKIIKEMDQQEDFNDKSQLQQYKNKQPKLQKETQIKPITLQNNKQKADKLQQTLIKKFPSYSPKNQQKLNQIKSNQVDFLLKSKSQQIPHRYCRICKTFQPLRVRHCHQCQKCICTFDHHCPWMNNCIGQKNRNAFWTYLLIQFVQFLLVLIDVGKKSLLSQQHKSRTYFFTVSILIVTLVSLILLLFHTYLMLKNMTTWQFVRWDRINYLSIYSYKKQSPFSYGFVKNLSDYFFPQKIPKQWIVNPQFIKKDNQYKKQTNPQKQQNIKPKVKSKVQQKAQTQRAIISHQH